MSDKKTKKLRFKQERFENRGGGGRRFSAWRVVEVEHPHEAPVGAVEVSDDTPLSDWSDWQEVQE